MLGEIGRWWQQGGVGSQKQKETGWVSCGTRRKDVYGGQGGGKAVVAEEGFAISMKLDRMKIIQLYLRGGFDRY